MVLFNPAKTLENSVAIISGGAGDIGGAIAIELARRGASIAVGDIKKSQDVKDLCEKIESYGSRAKYTQIDVSRAEDTTAWVLDVEREIGVANIIVPCAAQVTFQETREITPKKWEEELNVNLNGAFYLAQAGALRLLEKNCEGSITFISSFAGVIPQVHHVAYSVSKAGINALTKVMALEFSPYKIRVNAIAPGNVYAGICRTYYDEHPESLPKDLRVIPTRVLVQPEEIAWLLANLCESQSLNITGTIIPLDGGMSALPDFRIFRGE